MISAIVHINVYIYVYDSIVALIEFAVVLIDALPSSVLGWMHQQVRDLGHPTTFE